MNIKSKMLLPRIEPDEEDPRANLAEALLIYKQAKDAAELLAPMYSSFSGRTEKEEAKKQLFERVQINNINNLMYELYSDEKCT